MEIKPEKSIFEQTKKPYSLWLPPGIVNKIKARAKGKGMTFQNHLTEILSKSLEIAE